MKMLLRSIGLIFLAAGMAAGPLGAQEGEEPPAPPPANAPFVVVNTQAILPQVPGAQDAQERFQEELQGYEQEVRDLRSEVDSLLTAYRQQEAMLSPDAKQERQQQILQKQQEIQTRAGELEQRAGERQQELLAPILERVSAVIEEIRRENGYTMVLDIAASGVVAADPSLDITALVIERLQSPGQASSNRP